MKVLLGLSLIAAVLAGSPLNNVEKVPLKALSFNQVMEIIGGFLDGMSTNVNATQVAPCVNNSGIIGLYIESAIKDFSNNTYEGTKNGFANLSNAFSLLPTFVQQCVPAALETAEAIEKVSVAWTHPTSLIYIMGKRILLNGVELYGDITNATAEYKSRNWFEFGFYIGQCVFKLIYVPKGELRASQDNEVTLAVSAMLKGLNIEVDENTLAILPSVGEQLDNAAVNLKQNTSVEPKMPLPPLAKHLKPLLLHFRSLFLIKPSRLSAKWLESL